MTTVTPNPLFEKDLRTLEKVRERLRNTGYSSRLLGDKNPRRILKAIDALTEAIINLKETEFA